MIKEQEKAERGLDISGYAGKWKVAQELATHNERRDGYQYLPYWERVRLLFLELGGEFKDRHKS